MRCPSPRNGKLYIDFLCSFIIRPLIMLFAVNFQFDILFLFVIHLPGTGQKALNLTEGNLAYGSPTLVTVYSCVRI